MRAGISTFLNKMFPLSCCPSAVTVTKWSRMANRRACLPVESCPRRMANPLTVDRPSSIESVAIACIGRSVASIIPITMSPMSVFFMVFHPTP